MTKETAENEKKQPSQKKHSRPGIAAKTTHDVPNHTSNCTFIISIHITLGTNVVIIHRYR